MEKQYKLTDRVSKDSLKSPTFKKWLKRVLCAVCIISIALQLTLCCIPMHASAQESDSIEGTWYLNDNISAIGIVDNQITDPFKTACIFDYISPNSSGVDTNYIRLRIDDANGVVTLRRFADGGSAWGSIYSSSGGWVSDTYRYITITSSICYNYSGVDITPIFLSWLQSNAVKQVTQVYDFTGEYRLFNEQLTNLSFAQAGTVTQTYQFDYRIWGGYSADYFTVQASGSQVDISYAFTDEESGGVTTVYRQLLRNGQIVGTWLVPRARLIYFESNPDDTTFQQWLLDNTTLVDESMLETVYDFGYNNGFNDGWTDNLIGDTLNAPIQALNNITLLQVGNTAITLGGVIFTMIVLCILIVFLKKFAGG